MLPVRGQDPLKTTFKHYKHGAKKRDLSFALDFAEFRALVTSDCHYCGAPPPEKTMKHHRPGRINGIDRIDSRLGYGTDNCVPCCTKCNGMKSNLDREEWFEQMRRILRHSESKGLTSPGT
jgi:hypothetical protein